MPPPPTIFTPEQSAAIAERKKTLLISAAAGSGKTATLTARVIESLLDPVAPADISRILVVTFTRAAAAELRQRIESAMQSALRADPENRRLSRQLLLLPAAKIATIDSFCAEVVRSEASSLGLSPAFRVPDESEGLLLQKGILEDLITEGYEGDLPFATAERFIAFCEEITGARNDSELSAIFLSVYEKTVGFSEGPDILKRQADERRSLIGQKIDETPFYRHIRQKATAFLSHYEAVYTALSTDFAAEDLRYHALLLQDTAELHAFRGALDAGYDNAFAFVKEKGLCKTRFPSLRGDAAAKAAPLLREIRAEMKEDYKELCKACFTFSTKEFEAAIQRSADFSALLADFLLLFDRRYQEEKRRRQLLDYADLERYALKLLLADGRPTPLAESMRDAFDYIYIDEYQDTNSMQHEIFSAIARENNRFMVGDVKQSIYSFRHAEPTIFAEMKRSFPDFTGGAPANKPAGSLFLSQNFRCDREIIDFTNAVFDRVFGAAGESIAYRETDRLTHGKKGYEAGAPVTVAVFAAENSADDADGPQDGEALADASRSGGALAGDILKEPDDADAAPPCDKEILYVAQEIRRLLSGGLKDDGTPIRPGDIAVLLRGGARDMHAFAEAIAAYGIPAEAEDDRSFFLNPEILLCVSLLTVIDNPEKEIPLAACLRSPLYGFTMDDLIMIRQCGEAGDSLFCALEKYSAQHADHEKCTAFLRDLGKFRRLAAGMPVDRLLARLYDETGLLALAGRGDPEKRREKNLILLYEYARRFEASSFRGLYHFISYVNELIRENKTIPREKSDDRADAVHIMTIHRSKGLEFPVCFLARAGRLYNRTASREPLVFSPEYGVITRFRDESGLALIDNPLRRLTLDRIFELENEEEMRLLYVALTRARERLYVTGKLPRRQSTEACFQKAARNRRFFSKHLAMGFDSYLSMLLSCVSGEEDFVTLLTPEAADAEKLPRTAENTAGTASEDAVTGEELRRRFAFVYPYQAVSALPEKISVSRLSPALLDESAADAAPPLALPGIGDRIVEETAVPAPGVPLPRFLMEETPPSGAARGTATHLFMQFFDPEGLRDNGAESELLRLRQNGFLTDADADMVYLDEVNAFRDSALFRALLSAKRVYRELRFHADLPAAAFTEDAEKKVCLRGERLFTQGVIDCIYFRPDGGYVLVDYKTDRVSEKERRSPDFAAGIIRKRHTEQLSYYAAAAEGMFGAPPAEVLVYSLPLGRAFPIDCLPITED